MTSLPVLRIRYAILVDLACILAAYLVSVLIRFEPEMSAWPFFVQYRGLLFLSMLVRIPVYTTFGLYHRLWRYASAREIVTIFFAGTASSVVIGLLNFGMLPNLGLPYCASRSVFLLDWLLNLCGLAGTRLILRLVQENASTRQKQALGSVFVRSPRKVLIAGAGDAGAMFVREMQHNPALGLVPVGFVDDDRKKVGRYIHGIRVLGQLGDVPALAKHHHVDEVISAMPTAPGTVIRELSHACASASLPLRTVPGLYELLDGSVSVRQLRQIKIEDLLRRKPVATDRSGIAAVFQGTRILITGAGGSIGSELCRQLARYDPAQLLLLGHGEFSIFNIERELRAKNPKVEIVPLIADIRDGERMDQICAKYQPSVIFHAAAHKHVPLMEQNVEEAFINNVVGTRNVIRAAERTGVERFVLISSDKAVNPTNVMGATKRLAEILVHSSAVTTGRPYVAVRFGNVLGSRGSAVPIFQEQIASGGPVTVTHPEMKRFFMTIPEAVQLVLQAAALGRGGETFLLDMGEPVKIVDLVNDLIELSGLTPGKDVQIVYTGLRPGEKMEEELLLASEQYGPTQHDKIFVLRNGEASPFAYSNGLLDLQIDAVTEAARRMQTAEVIAGLQQIVPEFKRSQGSASAVGSPDGGASVIPADTDQWPNPAVPSPTTHPVTNDDRYA